LVADVRAWVGERRLVGLLGVIGGKKNVPAFVDVARRADRVRPDLAFVLAGDFSTQACPPDEHRHLSRVLADLPTNCRLFSDPIPDGPQFNAWVAACDVVWLAYRDVFFKSNVLTKAAHFRRPVLASPGRVMATHVARYRLGEIVNPLNSDEVLAAIDGLANEPPTGRGYAEFAALNCRTRLAETVESVLAAFRE
jgi:hypothetical protein